MLEFTSSSYTIHPIKYLIQIVTCAEIAYYLLGFPHRMWLDSFFRYGIQHPQDSMVFPQDHFFGGVYSVSGPGGAI